MRDPFTWSLPLGRMFGVTVRLHILFPIFILVMWLRIATAPEKDGYPDGAALQMLVLMALLFFSVLLHELGHCFGARLMDGDADEVLLWPLGGLARCDVPNTPRAHFWTAAYGPLTNLLLCVLAGGVLVGCSFVPSFDPRFEQCWQTLLYNYADKHVYGSEYAGAAAQARLEYWQILVARFFWVNWFGFLLNVLVIGFPLDGGRMFQALLWPRFGYRQAMQTAIFLGFLFMFLIGVYSLVVKDPLVLCLAGFIYFSCKAEWIQLEMGSEDSVFGYDFSQGYTSLERDEPPPAAPKKKRLNFLQRWLQRRASNKLRREQEREAADDRRMDELLEKIARDGKESLTDEENRFLKRVSDKYRNRP